MTALEASRSRLQRSSAAGKTGLDGRSDRPRRLRGGREGGGQGRPDRRRCPSRRAARMRRRIRPTSTPSPFSSRLPTASATICGRQVAVSAEELLIDKAQLLTLSAPEMTVLVGGMRVLNANTDQSAHGVFTDKAETLSTDFFVNLLDMDTEWKPVSAAEDVFEGRDRQRRRQMDRHKGRSGLWIELAASRAVGSLCRRRCRRPVCRRFRRGLVKGDGSGPFRRRLTPVRPQHSVRRRDPVAAPFFFQKFVS